MGELIHMNRLRAVGATLVWRRTRHELSNVAAFALADEIQWLLQMPGRSALHGFVIDTTKRGKVELSGWDLGPIVMTRAEAAELGNQLATAVSRRLEKRR